MRRVDVTGGNLTLMDYCTAGPQYASGGFIADSRTGFVINGSQQQWLTRDSQIGGWSNGVWNQVFSGVVGAPPQTFPKVGDVGPYTTLPTTPVSRERPYLYVDGSGAWRVFVPAPRTDSSGTTWAAGSTPGRSVALSEFQVVSTSTPWSTINAATAQGRNLLLLPGVYDVSRAITVKRAGSVVLGLGFPTLTPTNGNAALEVADVPGVDVAGLIIDAGSPTSPALMTIGTGRAGKGKAAQASDPANPTGLQDVFFRIGGPHAGSATVALQVNSDHVVLDDIWAWRADHGKGVGWTVNTSDTGVVVTGDDVTATGLFSEHFQKENVIWSGERGRTVFFQNELPYDAPEPGRLAARRHPRLRGLQGGRHRQAARAVGRGQLHLHQRRPHAARDARVRGAGDRRACGCTTCSRCRSTRPGTIDHVVNDVGAPGDAENFQGPSTVTSYP